MAKLYCKEHGERYRDLDKQGPDPGCYTKAVFGTLKAGSWRCDKCNLEIQGGDSACFLDYFVPSMRDAHGEVDFFGENATNITTVWQGGVSPNT